MKITNISVTPFRTWVDRYLNGEPLPRTEIIQTLTTIETDEGATGFYLGGQGHGDQDGLDEVSRAFVEQRIRPHAGRAEPVRSRAVLALDVGVENTREHHGRDRYGALGSGRQGRPGCRLQAAGRLSRQGKAYASTYPNMGSVQNYAEHAIACPRAGLSGVQDSSVLLLGSEDGKRCRGGRHTFGRTSRSFMPWPMPSATTWC